MKSGWIEHKGKRILTKAVVIFWCIPVLLFAQSVNLPPDHWAYGFFERMETRGVVANIRSGSKPFTREKAASLVLQLDRECSTRPDRFSKIEKQFLERLKGEFFDELRNTGVSIRSSEMEPHFYSWEKSPDFVHLDAVGGGRITVRGSGAETAERRIYAPYYGAVLRGSIRGAGVYSDSRIFAEWGTRKYIQNYRASQGYPNNAERDSSRATWDVSDSYFTFPVKGFQFEFGRDNLKWARSNVAGLFLSGRAPSFDMLKMRIAFGKAEFTWAHAELRSDFSRKWLSAHRLEFSPARGLDIGIHEAVVYGRRGLEPAYLNPILPFLVAQHSLGDRDNLALGADASLCRIRNVKLYGELFVDDLFAPWAVFDDYWGNRLAFTAGGHWVDPLGLRNSELRVEYTRIEPYVYSHKDSVNVFEHYNSGLGHFLQPNSDGWFAEAKTWFDFRFQAAFRAGMAHHGRGDRRTPHLDEDGDRKSFLGGIVEKQTRVAACFEGQPVRDVFVRFELGRIWIRNRSHRQNDNGDWNEMVVSAHLNW